MAAPIGPTISNATLNFLDDPETQNLRIKAWHLKGMLDPVVNPRTERQQFWINTAKVVAAVASVALVGVCIWLAIPIFLCTSLPALTAFEATAGVLSLSASPITLSLSITSIFWAAFMQSHEQHIAEKEKQLYDYVTDPRKGVNILFDCIDNRFKTLFPENPNPNHILLDPTKFEHVKAEVENTKNFLTPFANERFFALPSTSEPKD